MFVREGRRAVSTGPRRGQGGKCNPAPVPDRPFTNRQERPH